jgi:hypothetical protein
MVLSPCSSKLQPTKPMLKFQICETLLLVFPNLFVDHTLPCLFKNPSCFGIYTKKIKPGIRLWVRALVEISQNVTSPLTTTCDL